MPSHFRMQLESWLKELEIKADFVLDIGGGQKPVKGRTKSWEVKEYKILDLPDWNLNNTWLYLDKKADIVFCLEVMEYIWQPNITISNLKNILKKDGILYISFPFIYPHHEPAETDYLRYTRWGVEKLLEETGFNILDIKSRKATKGYSGLLEFFIKEKMKMSRNFGDHDDTGYLIKAQKI